MDGIAARHPSFGSAVRSGYGIGGGLLLSETVRDDIGALMHGNAGYRLKWDKMW